jgi:predicted RNA binding protein YcfA (HicA-like mRNA interferase family)
MWQLGKLRILSGKEVCMILANHDFFEVHQWGSHIVMQKQLTDTIITVPVLNHPEVHIGMLQSIIRQSGIPRSEFE